MKKLYVCEYPFILYKTLVERMGDEENSYSLILSDAKVDMKPLVPVLRQSGLFEQVEFFSCEAYRDYYNLYFPYLPKSPVRSALMWLKNQLKISLYQKRFKEIDFSFNIDFMQYDKIICTELPCVINGYLSMNHIEYAITEHARIFYKRGTMSKKLAAFLCVLGILDKLHILNGTGAVSGFCKEVIVYDASNIPLCIRNKTVTAWNVDEHIEELDARQKDQIFQLYAKAYGLRFDAEQTYDLLLTTPLYTDSYLPSEKSQIKFYKDMIQDYFKYPVLIKPHPRDSLDYKKFFPECVVIHEGVSSEILNFSQNLKLGTVFTVDSSSAPSFREKAEKLIILEKTGAPVNQMKSLESYR